MCIRDSIDVDQDATIKTFLPFNSSSIDIAYSKSLTLTNSFEVLKDQIMELKGIGGGTLNFSDNLTLSGTLKLNALNNTLTNGTLIFNNGLLKLDENTTVSMQISLADNASMEIANAKQLNVTKAFEIPENLELKMVAVGGGTLSLTDTLKIKGTLQFAAPGYSFENGTLELSEGGLLDVYNLSLIHI